MDESEFAAEVECYNTVEIYTLQDFINLESESGWSLEYQKDHKILFHFL